MRLFRPIIAGATWRDRAIGCIAATIAITVTAIVCRLVAPTPAGVAILIAATGGSAAIIFTVPASPLAQPWSVIGGNVSATLTGIAAARLIPDPSLAAGVAVGGSILVMSLLRCLHPPGGAAALMTVIGGPALHAEGWWFAFTPVAVNAVVLVLLAMLLHRATGHSYPHRPAPPAPADPGLARADIDAALTEMHESFDIARADLDALLLRAEAHAAARRR